MGRPTHGYTLPDGTPVPGVTTVCGMLAKPALVGWAGKTMHAAGVEHGRACFAAGRDGEQPPAFPKWTDTLYGQRDQAASDGTLVHDMFEAHLRGQEVHLDGVSDAARQGYENAAHWLESSSLQIESHESPLVSETWRYGGTPDAIARQGNRVMLADWKTGGVYPEHAIQMAAYAVLLRECEGTEVDGVHLVRFSRDHGDFTHHFWSRNVLEEGWTVFVHLLQVRDPLARLQKRCR